MKTITELKKELEIKMQEKKEEENKLYDNLFKFIQSADILDITDWEIKNDDYYMTISKDNIDIVIIVEQHFDEDDGDYYCFTIRIKNNKKVIYSLDFHNCNGNKKDEISVINEKISLLYVLAAEKNVSKYENIISDYKILNQILG